MTPEERIAALEARLARLETRGPLMGVYAVKNATTNTVIDQLRIERGSTGTPADGIGSAIVILVEDASGNKDEVGNIDAVLTTAAHATQAGEVRLGVMGKLCLALTSAGVTVAGDATDADGTQVLKLNAARAWAFVQRGTGAATRLQLQDLNGGKIFEIGSPDGTKRAAQFFPSNTAGSNVASLVPDGGDVKIGGKIIYAGANDSYSAGYRTLFIQNA